MPWRQSDSEPIVYDTEEYGYSESLDRLVLEWGSWGFEPGVFHEKCMKSDMHVWIKTFFKPWPELMWVALKVVLLPCSGVLLLFVFSFSLTHTSRTTRLSTTFRYIFFSPRTQEHAKAWTLCVLEHLYLSVCVCACVCVSPILRLSVCVLCFSLFPFPLPLTHAQCNITIGIFYFVFFMNHVYFYCVYVQRTED